MTEREVRSLPMVALRGMTVLPEMVTHFDVSRERSIEAIKEAMQEDGQKIFLTAQLDIEVEEPSAQDLCQVGTIASIRQVIKLPRNLLRVLISGEERASINTVEFETPYMRANVTVLPDTEEEPAAFIVLIAVPGSSIHCCILTHKQRKQQQCTGCCQGNGKYDG